LILEDELKHHNFLKSITKEEVKPNKSKIFFYILLCKIFGLAFSLRFMESKEEDAQGIYEELSKTYPNAINIKKDEEEHERKLINILNDEKLNYAGSIVLGLNDALVELTGTLAGLTFAFANTSIIGITGLIMGIAASMSMAASGYLSSKEEESKSENAITSAIYTV
jgi:VIT1/CCC1 family predicted Fe2+/Mn2+ transporter